MEINNLLKTAINALEDVKAKDILVIETATKTPLFEKIILACGDSTRQVKALAGRVARDVKDNGGEVFAMEGEEEGNWVLVDLGDIIVHIMLPAVRKYYNLEELWSE